MASFRGSSTVGTRPAMQTAGHAATSLDLESTEADAPSTMWTRYRTSGRVGAARQARPHAAAIAVAALATLLAACGPAHISISSPTANAAPDSGISGETVLGPTCPVQRAGAPPCVSVVSAEVRVTDAGGTVVADVRSGPDGKFTIALQPGTYVIAGIRGPSGPGMFTTAQTVVVTAHSYTAVTVTFDTGIR